MALTLTRKTGEAIQVGEATIYVNKIKGGSVSLAIEAPKHVPIRRTELKGGKSQ